VAGVGGCSIAPQTLEHTEGTYSQHRNADDLNGFNDYTIMLDNQVLQIAKTRWRNTLAGYK
jgi:hypothetical protein